MRSLALAAGGGASCHLAPRVADILQRTSVAEISFHIILISSDYDNVDQKFLSIYWCTNRWYGWIQNELVDSHQGYCERKCYYYNQPSV
jgi:hypothetical protein